MKIDVYMFAKYSVVHSRKSKMATTTTTCYGCILGVASVEYHMMLGGCEFTGSQPLCSHELMKTKQKLDFEKFKRKYPPLKKTKKNKCIECENGSHGGCMK